MGRIKYVQKCGLFYYSILILTYLYLKGKNIYDKNYRFSYGFRKNNLYDKLYEE